MSVPIAQTAGRPRILRVVDEPPGGPEAPSPATDRRPSRAERRYARRQRQLGAALGLTFLCLILVATVLVLDAVR